jgi:thiol:disulfide interchange protein DsbD
VRFYGKIAFVALASLGAPGAYAAHTQARLLLAADAAKPGETVLAGLDLKMEPEWHTYWKNPGSSGMATKIEWQLPKGVTAGPVLWPVPEKLTEKLTGEDFTSYIYTNEVMLVIPLTLAADLPAGPLELKAKVSWLECKQECIKAGADVKASLTIGSETKASASTGPLQTWRKKLPEKAEGLSARAWWEKAAAGDLRPLIIEWTPKQSGSAQ